MAKRGSKADSDGIATTNRLPSDSRSRRPKLPLDFGIASHDFRTLKGQKVMNDIASWIWILIPLAAIGIAPFKMWLKIKEKQIVAQTDLAAERSAQYASHVERIEARLRVLEQIVTDGGAQTANQIEALRDQARIPIEDKTP